MAGKEIDITTAGVEELAKVVVHIDKAKYWYGKQIGSIDKLKNMLCNLLPQTKGMEYIAGGMVKYKDPMGFEWIMFHAVRYSDENHFSYQYGFRWGITFETYGVGVFTTMMFKSDGTRDVSESPEDDAQRYIVIFNPHLIDRYQERFGKNMGRDDLIADLLAKTAFSHFTRTTYKGEPSVALIDHDIICLGVERSDGVLEMKTVINKQNLTDSQRALYEEAIRRNDESIADMEYVADSNMAYYAFCKEGEKEIDVVFGEVGWGWLDGDYFDKIVGVRKTKAVFDCYNAFTDKYPKPIKNCDDGNFYVEQWDFAVKAAREKNPLSRTQGLALILNTISLHDKNKMFSPKKRIEPLVVEKSLKNIIKLDNKIKQFRMEKQARTELGRILKNRGLTSKFEKEVEKLSAIQKDQYYAQAETLYVISRVIPNVDNDSLRTKLEAANLEWTRLVIEKDLCQPIAPWVEKHGKEMVCKAVEYLMQNHLWESPTADKALKTKQPTNYDGLKAIDEAVEFLKSMEAPSPTPQQSEAEPSEEETQAVEGVPFDAEALQKTASEYKKQKATLQSMADQLSEMARTVAAFRKENFGDEFVQELFQENDALRAQVKEREKEKEKSEEEYGKKIAEQESKNRTLRSELDRLRAANKEQSEKLFAANKRADEADKRAERATLKQKEAERDIEALKKQYEELNKNPCAKTIRLSELKDLPLVGPTVLKSLLPFLEKKSIVVDMNR